VRIATKALKAVPAYIARTQFGELMQRAVRNHDRFLIKKAGKPMVVIMGIEDYEELMEILAEETDADFQESLRESEEDYKLGRFSTLDEILETFEGTKK